MMARVQYFFSPACNSKTKIINENLYNYHTRAIITRGLYIFYPLF